MIAINYKLEELHSYPFACFVFLLIKKTNSEGSQVPVETHNIRGMCKGKTQNAGVCNARPK